MAEILIQTRINCLGQTCLHWHSDGELSEEDRLLVFERLLQADGCSSAWGECWVSSDPRSVELAQPG
jgi:hypothetical protein